jgi:hypothetical protein
MSKEELNNDFDVAVRLQKQFEESVAEKVKNHQGLNDVEIAHLCPVALKDQMSEGEIKKLGLSKHYSFVPTMKVVNDLRELGYECVDATQVKARKKSTNGYQKHMLTFEHPDHKVEGSEEYPQILLTNSHDGGNAFTLSAGIFRLVCSNGLVIKTEDYGSARLVHKGYSFEAVQKLVKEFEETISEVLTKITAMKKVELTKEQQIQFAGKAALLRFTAKSYNEDNIADVVQIDDLLYAERPEDKGNGLYEVYNRVQESLVKGKYLYASSGKVNAEGTKVRKGREIKNFKQSIDVNKKLSELAFELV